MRAMLPAPWCTGNAFVSGPCARSHLYPVSVPARFSIETAY